MVAPPTDLGTGTGLAGGSVRVALLKAGSSVSEKLSSHHASGDLTLAPAAGSEPDQPGMGEGGRGGQQHQQQASFFMAAPASAPASASMTQPAIKAMPPIGVTKPKTGMPVSASR